MTLNQENGRDWILIKRKLFNMKTNLITITALSRFYYQGSDSSEALAITGGIPNNPPIVIAHRMTCLSALLSPRLIADENK